MARFVILLNGPMHPSERLKGQIRGARVIAADGGIRHADTLGVRPQVWLGDFDSSRGQLQEKWSDVRRLEWPEDKDFSDGELAINHALGEGASEIMLVGALGGRADLGFSHLMALIHLEQNGIAAFASDGKQEIWPLTEAMRIPEIPENSRLSIAAVAPIEGLNLAGTRWPLSNASLAPHHTLGMSNIVTGKLSISISGGYGFVFVSQIPE